MNYLIDPCRGNHDGDHDGYEQEKENEMNIKAQRKQEQKEAQVVLDMSRAKAITDVVFGAQSTTQAALEIYGWTEGADDDGIEAFKNDLKRAVDYASTAFGTETPTPEMVFGVFDAIHGEDEEE